MTFTKQLTMIILLALACAACAGASAQQTPCPEPRPAVCATDAECAEVEEFVHHLRSEQGAAEESKRTETCGAPIKTTGKKCTRRVRGGGLCWQHRARDDRFIAQREAPASDEKLLITFDNIILRAPSSGARRTEMMGGRLHDQARQRIRSPPLAAGLP